MYVYIQIHVYIYAYICAYICMHVHMYIRINVHIHAYIHIYISYNTKKSVKMYTYLCTYIHTQMNVRRLEVTLERKEEEIKAIVDSAAGIFFQHHLATLFFPDTTKLLNCWTLHSRQILSKISNIVL